MDIQMKLYVKSWKNCYDRSHYKHMRKQYSCSRITPHQEQNKHYPQHNAHTQDVHLNITNNVTINSERGNTAPLGNHTRVYILTETAIRLVH